MFKEILADNEKLVKKFGAKRISSLKHLPDFYTFTKGLIYSHRDFDKFFKALERGEKCAIVSGFNASGTIHLGHKAVFDTNLYFQREFDIPVFIPISDDESYVAGKIKTQEEALENSLQLVKELIAYGFDPNRTYFIIDQIYTNIYNLAIKLSKKITLSEVKATYGYKNEDNPGLYFYPAVQSAHILLPQELGIKHVLVPIGPDEDSHLRICRDVAARFGYEKPSVIHLEFMPGIDGEKMSKSKNNAIFFSEDSQSILKKIRRALSGGKKGIEEHRKRGGDPEKDIACQYLAKFFLTKEEGEKLFKEYRAGRLLSKEVKDRLARELLKFIGEFQARLKKVSDEDVSSAILRNEGELPMF
ncbi:MAG: tryptophan--tRNA ligase [Candidatus Helarchaeota archaeon]